MTTPLASALDYFYLEHRRCGELDAGVEDDRVWMARFVRGGDHAGAGARRP